MIIPELLAPAGGPNQLNTAIRFGADAVYFGLSEFGLRARAHNFTPDAMADAVRHAHAHGVKAFLTLNIFAYDEDIGGILDAARAADRAGVDAVIMADPGAIAAVHEALPDLPIHLSTQANVMNAAAARFWHAQGVSRIVLSRELSIGQIRRIRDHVPDALELEAFAHGAVCMAYSGRCALSSHMAGRSANRGDCAQPCRWRYHLVEEKRPGQYFPVDEGPDGAHIFSAGDLCMVAHLAELTSAGLHSIKIEGRMKNEYYVATVVSAYRRGLDALKSGTYDAAQRAELLREVAKAGHRRFDTGFYLGAPEHPGGASGAMQTMQYIARVLAWGDGVARVELRNRVALGDALDLMRPDGGHPFVLGRLWTPSGEALQACATPMAQLNMRIPLYAEPGDLIRGTCTNHPHGE